MDRTLPLQLAKGTLAIEHARIYISPTDPPIDDGTILVRDGLIAAVGTPGRRPRRRHRSFPATTAW